uniref:Secreted protein n=1 Tax=Heterorhabditis bacteriophora TaxID=37862 RepID=A0A1I7WZA5_HETBA
MLLLNVFRSIFSNCIFHILAMHAGLGETRHYHQRPTMTQRVVRYFPPTLAYTA